MENKSLFELICEINELISSRRCNKQLIIDRAVQSHNKFLNYIAVVNVCKILIQNFNDAYTLEQNLDLAIYDYINQ